MTRWRLRKAADMGSFTTSLPTVYGIVGKNGDGTYSFHLGSDATGGLFYRESGFATADEARDAALEYVRRNESRLLYQEGFGRKEEGAAMARKNAGVEWREEYDGSMWADVDGIQLSTGEDGGVVWWSVYDATVDKEIAGGFCDDIEEGKSLCEQRVTASRTAGLNLDAVVGQVNAGSDGMWDIKVDVRQSGDEYTVTLVDRNEFVSSYNCYDGFIRSSVFEPIENAVREQTGDPDFFFDCYDTITFVGTAIEGGFKFETGVWSEDAGAYHKHYTQDISAVVGQQSGGNWVWGVMNDFDEHIGDCDSADDGMAQADAYVSRVYGVTAFRTAGLSWHDEKDGGVYSTESSPFTLGGSGKKMCFLVSGSDNTGYDISIGKFSNGRYMGADYSSAGDAFIGEYLGGFDGSVGFLTPDDAMAAAEAAIDNAVSDGKARLAGRKEASYVDFSKIGTGWTVIDGSYYYQIDDRCIELYEVDGKWRIDAFDMDGYEANQMLFGEFPTESFGSTQEAADWCDAHINWIGDESLPKIGARTAWVAKGDTWQQFIEDFEEKYVGRRVAGDWFEQGLIFSDEYDVAWQREYDDSPYGMIGEAYGDGSWYLYAPMNDLGEVEIVEAGQERDLELAMALCDVAAESYRFWSKQGFASRKVASVDWKYGPVPKYDGEWEGWYFEDGSISGLVMPTGDSTPGYQYDANLCDGYDVIWEKWCSDEDEAKALVESKYREYAGKEARKASIPPFEQFIFTESPDGDFYESADALDSVGEDYYGVFEFDGGGWSWFYSPADSPASAETPSPGNDSFGSPEEAYEDMVSKVGMKTADIDFDWESGFETYPPEYEQLPMFTYRTEIKGVPVECCVFKQPDNGHNAPWYWSIHHGDNYTWLLDDGIADSFDECEDAIRNALYGAALSASRKKADEDYFGWLVYGGALPLAKKRLTDMYDGHAYMDGSWMVTVLGGDIVLEGQGYEDDIYAAMDSCEWAFEDWYKERWGSRKSASVDENAIRQMLQDARGGRAEICFDESGNQVYGDLFESYEADGRYFCVHASDLYYDNMLACGWEIEEFSDGDYLTQVDHGFINSADDDEIVGEVMSWLRSHGASRKSADYFNPNDEALELMNIDMKIWRRNGYEHGGAVRADFDNYCNSVCEALDAKGIYHVSDEAVDDLVDSNFHSLVECLRAKGYTDNFTASRKKKATDVQTWGYLVLPFYEDRLEWVRSGDARNELGGDYGWYMDMSGDGTYVSSHQDEINALRNAGGVFDGTAEEVLALTFATSDLTKSQSFDNMVKSWSRKTAKYTEFEWPIVLNDASTFPALVSIGESNSGEYACTIEDSTDRSKAYDTYFGNTLEEAIDNALDQFDIDLGERADLFEFAESELRTASKTAGDFDWFVMNTYDTYATRDYGEGNELAGVMAEVTQSGYWMLFDYEEYILADGHADNPKAGMAAADAAARELGVKGASKKSAAVSYRHKGFEVVVGDNPYGTCGWIVLDVFGDEIGSSDGYMGSADAMEAAESFIDEYVRSARRSARGRTSQEHDGWEQTSPNFLDYFEGGYRATIEMLGTDEMYAYVWSPDSVGNDFEEFFPDGTPVDDIKAWCEEKVEMLMSRTAHRKVAMDDAEFADLIMRNYGDFYDDLYNSGSTGPVADGDALIKRLVNEEPALWSEVMRRRFPENDPFTSDREVGAFYLAYQAASISKGALESMDDFDFDQFFASRGRAALRGCNRRKFKAKSEKRARANCKLASRRKVARNFPQLSEFKKTKGIFGDDRWVYQDDNVIITIGKELHGIISDDTWGWEIADAYQPADLMAIDLNDTYSLEECYEDLRSEAFAGNISGIWYDDMKDVVFGMKRAQVFPSAGDEWEFGTVDYMTGEQGWKKSFSTPDKDIVGFCAQDDDDQWTWWIDVNGSQAMYEWDRQSAEECFDEVEEWVADELSVTASRTAVIALDDMSHIGDIWEIQLGDDQFFAGGTLKILQLGPTVFEWDIYNQNGYWMGQEGTSETVEEALQDYNNMNDMMIEYDMMHASRRRVSARDVWASNFDKLGATASRIASIKDELLALGVPENEIDTYEGDLYVKVSPLSQQWVDGFEYKNQVTRFIDNIDHEPWFEIPFGNIGGDVWASKTAFTGNELREKFVEPFEEFRGKLSDSEYDVIAEFLLWADMSSKIVAKKAARDDWSYQFDGWMREYPNGDLGWIEDIEETNLYDNGEAGYDAWIFRGGVFGEGDENVGWFSDPDEAADACDEYMKMGSRKVSFFDSDILQLVNRFFDEMKSDGIELYGDKGEFAMFAEWLRDEGRFASRKTAGGWESGVVTVNGNAYDFQAKVYDEPSIYGIDEGCISKLIVKHYEDSGWARPVLNYDRGWDVEPQTDEQREILDKILGLYKEGARTASTSGRGTTPGGISYVAKVPTGFVDGSWFMEPADKYEFEDFVDAVGLDAAEISSYIKDHKLYNVFSEFDGRVLRDNGSQLVIQLNPEGSTLSLTKEGALDAVNSLLAESRDASRKTSRMSLTQLKSLVPQFAQKAGIDQYVYGYIYDFLDWADEQGLAGLASRKSAADRGDKLQALYQEYMSLYGSGLSREAALAIGDFLDWLYETGKRAKHASRKVALSDDDFATCVDDTYAGCKDFIEEGYDSYSDVQSEAYSYCQSWADEMGVPLSSDEEDEIVQIVMDELEHEGVVS